MHRPLDVLLVDDDNVTLAYLRELVMRLGATASTVGDAASARGALEQGRFDLMICDLRLPDASGASLVAVARGTVCVAMSAHVDATLARRLRRAGFAAVIEKPVAAGVLAALVQKHFGESPSARNRPYSAEALNEHSQAHDDSVSDAAGWPRLHTVALVDPACADYTVRPTPAADAMLEDDPARTACGSDEVVSALRRLFGAELRRTRVHIRQALRTRRYADARESLHKLAASCGLVGARALQATTVSLMRAIDSGEPDRRTVLAFDRLAGKTLVALQLPRT